MTRHSLLDAIHAAVKTGPRMFNGIRKMAAQDGVVKEGSKFSVEEKIEINRILEVFLSSTSSVLSNGMTRVSVMKIDSYKEVMKLKSGQFELDPERLQRIPRGVYQALVKAGYKPIGIARFTIDFDRFDPREVTWVLDEFGNSNFSAQPLREFKEIELFVEFARH